MFKLDLKISESNIKIGLDKSLFLIGSCFSNEIGSLLSAYKFNTLSNPGGIIYNPISIFKILEGSIDRDNIVTNNGISYHWDYHGSISATTKLDLNQKVDDLIKTTRSFLETSDIIIISLGTSFVYEKEEKIVANCHKVPSKEFNKRLLSKEEILEAYDAIYPALSKKDIIFTVSPVRHIRDGLVENNLSKSILLQAVHELVEKYQNIEYFPSYEIIIDELRDYRFYKSDMIHPSEQAVEYIWNKFASTYFDEHSLNFCKKWQKILNSIHHKPFLPESESHQNFLSDTIKELKNLNDQIDVSNEIDLLEKQLR